MFDLTTCGLALWDADMKKAGPQEREPAKSKGTNNALAGPQIREQNHYTRNGSW